MNRFSIQSVFLSAIAIVLIGMINIDSVYAMGSKAVPASGLTLQQKYTWFDGDRERTVWLNPQLVAEFNPTSENRKKIKKAFSTAVEIPSRQASVRLWKLSNNGITAKNTMQSLKISQTANSKYSAVLHDSPSSAGTKRALPGNIIVHLNPSWDQARVEAWLNENNLAVVKKLNIGNNVLVIKTEPGLVSLEIANKVRQVSGVVAAYPDWWKEVFKK